MAPKLLVVDEAGEQLLARGLMLEELVTLSVFDRLLILELVCKSVDDMIKSPVLKLQMSYEANVLDCVVALPFVVLTYCETTTEVRITPCSRSLQ